MRTLNHICLSLAVTLLAFAFSASEAVAQDQDAGRFRGNEELNDEAHIRRLGILATNLCIGLSYAYSEGSQEPGMLIDRAIANYNGWDESDPKLALKIAEFFNRNNQFLICDPTPAYPRQHWFARALEMKFYQRLLIYHYLEDEEKYPLNLNFIYVIDQRPRTILDTLDELMARDDFSVVFNVAEISELRRIMVTFYGAKTISELAKTTVR